MRRAHRGQAPAPGARPLTARRVRPGEIPQPALRPGTRTFRLDDGTEVTRPDVSDFTRPEHEGPSVGLLAALTVLVTILAVAVIAGV